MMFFEENSSEPSSPEGKQYSEYQTLEDFDKIQTRRVKNRVQARKSRRRRKVKIEGLEKNVELLQIENNTLQSECSGLKDLMKKLAQENMQLRNKFANNASASGHTSSSGDKKEQNVRVALTAETLLELWKEVSEVQIPECLCTE